MSLLLAAGLVLTALLVSACPSLPQPEEPFPHVIAMVPEWSGFIETDQWNFGATLITTSPKVLEVRFIGAQIGDQFVASSVKDEWTAVASLGPEIEAPLQRFEELHRLLVLHQAGEAGGWTQEFEREIEKEYYTIRRQIGAGFVQLRERGEHIDQMIATISSVAITAGEIIVLELMFEARKRNDPAEIHQIKVPTSVTKLFCLVIEEPADCLVVEEPLEVFPHPPVVQDEAGIIRDPNLEAVIRVALRIGPDVNICRSALEGLTELRPAGRDIPDLTGLEYAVNLQVLLLGNNRITDISPLSGLVNLERLCLSDNQITDISALSGLVNLERLALLGNQITDISPLSDLVKLERLCLWGNQITDVSPLSGLVNLWELFLDYNQITDITPLSDLARLEFLRLSYNRIRDISPLSGLVRLGTLFLDNNQITDITPLSGLARLEFLRLSNNLITDTSPLSGLVKLGHLFLANNQIADISHLVANEGLARWDMICLRRNPLSEESLNTYIPDLKARGVQVYYHRPVVQDEVVTIPDPNLEAAIREALRIWPDVNICRSALEGLTELRAIGKGISDITGLEYAVNLQVLWLGDNQITDISPLSGLVNLPHLWLWGNRISDISALSGLVNLERLALWDNQITDISPLSGLVNLESLSLAYNQITDISPLSGLVNLWELFLDYNQITDIAPLSGLARLHDLRLSNNRIMDISPLSGVVRLGHLNLANNQIANISPLVSNEGLWGIIRLSGNPLSEESLNTHIPELKARGVTIHIDR